LSNDSSSWDLEKALISLFATEVSAGIQCRIPGCGAIVDAASENLAAHYWGQHRKLVLITTAALVAAPVIRVLNKGR